MLLDTHPPTDIGECQEVMLLSRQHWIRLEMRNHRLHQRAETTDFPLQRAITSVRSNRSALEVPLNFIQNFAAVIILTDR
jgi:hypothetical protein